MNLEEHLDQVAANASGEVNGVIINERSRNHIRLGPDNCGSWPVEMKAENLFHCCSCIHLEALSPFRCRHMWQIWVPKHNILHFAPKSGLPTEREREQLVN